MGAETGGDGEGTLFEAAQDHAQAQTLATLVKATRA